MIKLYLTPGTRAGRVAWLLEELKIEYDLEVLPFTKEGLKSPEHRSRHALGRVPVIEDGDISIFESGADRKSTRLNSSHSQQSRMPSSA